MNTGRNNKIIKKKYMQFFFSVLFSVLILQITTIIDSMIVGTVLGTKEMSGVKAASPVISLMMVFGVLVSVGISLVISISLGKRDIKKANTAYSFGLWLSILVGLVITLIGFFLSDAIISLITSDNNILEFAKTYSKTVLIAAPFYMLSSYLGYVIRSDGFPKLSMVLLISGGLINVSFDLIFMLGFKLGVRGAAIATDVSFIGSTLIGIIYLFMKNRNLHFVNIFKNKEEIKDIFKISMKNGFPGATRLLLTNIAIIVSNFVIGKYVGYMGIALFTVVSNLGLIATGVFQASGVSMMPIMGVFFGEKDYRGCELLIRYVIAFLLGIVVVIIALIVAFANFYFPLFGIKDPSDEFVLILRLYSLGFIFAGLNYIILYYFNGLQKLVISLLVPLIEQVIIYIPLTLWLIPTMGMYGLIVIFIASEAATTIITILLLFIIKKKKNYANLLLLPKNKNDVLLDFTVLASNIEASTVSENVGKILLENNIEEKKCNHVAVLLEELIISTKEKKVKNKKVYIDVRIIKSEENIIVSMRSNGYPYNPLIDNDEITQSLIESFAIKCKYNQIIGFNQTLIEV